MLNFEIFWFFPETIKLANAVRSTLIYTQTDGSKSSGICEIGSLIVDSHVTMQTSFSDLAYAAKKKMTRRERFLGEINAVTPWSALVAEIEPFQPKGEGPGRPPIGVQRMLRMHIAHQG